jgi:DNA-binding GntR family transcriptional regulator
VTITAEGESGFGSSGEHVYQLLRSAIVMGGYPPGSPLRLQELSRQFGVSLIPIREALRRLEVERLVENQPNRGARVASISRADVEDAYNARILLETEMLRRAWPQLDRHAVRTARAILHEMLSAFEEGRLADGADLHRSYHFTLWEKARSQWLDHLVRILWSHTERYRNLALRLHAPTRAHGEYHRVALRAIEEGDLDTAIRHTEEELGRARDLVIQHLAESAEYESESQSA